MSGVIRTSLWTCWSTLRSNSTVEWRCRVTCLPESGSIGNDRARCCFWCDGAGCPGWFCRNL
jgi:hypothetical protein